MLVVVRKRRTDKILFTITGDVDHEVVAYLYKLYGYENVKDDDEAMDIQKTAWYKKMQKTHYPGRTVRVYRENQGLTKKQLGEKIGQSARFITDIESGKSELSKDLVKTFSKLFDIPTSMLLPNKKHKD